MLDIKEICDVFGVSEINVNINNNSEIELSCDIVINSMTCLFPIKYGKTIYDYNISKVKKLEISDIYLDMFNVPKYTESLELVGYNIETFDFLNGKNIIQLILKSCKLENNFKGIQEGLKILILKDTFSENIKGLPKSLNILWNDGLIPEYKEYDEEDIIFLDGLQNTNFKKLGNYVKRIGK